LEDGDVVKSINANCKLEYNLSVVKYSRHMWHAGVYICYLLCGWANGRQ